MSKIRGIVVPVGVFTGSCREVFLGICKALGKGSDARIVQECLLGDGDLQASELRHGVLTSIELFSLLVQRWGVWIF